MNRFILSWLYVWLSILTCCPFSAYAGSHQPQTFLKKIAGTPNEGEQIVQHYCVNCHGEKPLIPLGAPSIGKAAEWKPRLQQSFELIKQHTDEGIGAMPARGGCFECSDEQLWLAIMAMLPAAQKNAFKIIVKENKKPNS